VENTSNNMFTFMYKKLGTFLNVTKFARPYRKIWLSWR